MAVAERRAEVTWEGTLAQGNGHISSGSGALGDLPVTWAARTERSDGKTSPEELLAAAHAACYAMAFSGALGRAGTPPERLHVEAVCTLDRIEGALKVTQMALHVTGRVPGVDAATFADRAQEAERGCPVSNALRNNVAISVHATLEA